MKKVVTDDIGFMIYQVDLSGSKTATHVAVFSVYSLPVGERVRGGHQTAHSRLLRCPLIPVRHYFWRIHLYPVRQRGHFLASPLRQAASGYTPTCGGTTGYETRSTKPSCSSACSDWASIFPLTPPIFWRRSLKR